MSLKILRNIFLGLAVSVIVFGVGYRAGNLGAGRNYISNTTVTGANSAKPISVDFSLFWTVWDRVNTYFIDKKAIDPQKMVYGAISGMVGALGDPYTVFLPPDQNKEAKDDLGGKFEGIGAQLGVTADKKVIVVSPLKDAPAEKAGLKPGDIIAKVDGHDTAGWTLPQAVAKIRGPKGSSVVLTVLHKNAVKTVDISVARDTINVSSVDWGIKNVQCNNAIPQCKIIETDCSDCQQVIYLKLSQFGDKTTDEWNKAVDAIETKLQSNGNKIKGLVFDLRNNPGGYLSGSVFIASEFLKDGTVVLQDSVSGGRQTYSVDRKGRLTDIPMVVMVNKGSASASEIVAGALQVRGRAKVVGETSFGKGSVQEAQDLPGGAGIHITTAKWLLPSGKWINGSGIDPDVKIQNDDTKPEEDIQLEKAVETLSR